MDGVSMGFAKWDPVRPAAMAASLGVHPDLLLLRPFDPTTAPQRLQLETQLRRQGPKLAIRWILSGDLRQLRLPDPEQDPQRRDGLWTSTCLECFLAQPGQEGYWELNLCPSGHWNLYRLEGYRQGLRPESALQRLPSRRRLDIAGDGQALELAVELDLEPLLAAEASRAALELGVTAVLECHDGNISYWALRHPAAEPDFHLRPGFCVRLASSEP
jgi:hypothetical protein